MNNLKTISCIDLKIADENIKLVNGGKKVPNYSNTWWYKGLDSMGKIAESGSDLWQIKYH